VRFLEPHITLGPPTVFEAAGPGTMVAAGNLDTSLNDAMATNDVVIIVPDPDPQLPGAIQVFLNQGTTGAGIWLGFASNTPITVGADPSGIVVADFNNDGFLDIAVSNATDDTVSILLNTGAGNATFVAAPDITGLNEPRALAAGDFTGDSGPDLIVARLGSDTVAVFENVAGSFALIQLVPVDPGLIALDPSDLDNNKDVDAVAAHFIGNSNSVLQNIGPGGPFNALPGLGVGTDPVDIATGDVDNNTFADIVTANSNDDTLSVVLNNGAFTFDVPFSIPTGMAPASVVIDDFDGDGDLDIAIVAEDPVLGPAIQVFENYIADGLGLVFGPPVAFSVGDGEEPNFLVSVDLNGDGIPDIVTVNTGDEPSGGSVTALLLTCPGDTNGDGVVGINDMLTLLSEWGPCDAPCPPTCVTDLDFDCNTGINDFLALLEAWGPCGQ